MWNGSIGFALVNIPVKMYVATEESRLPFVSLDKNNHAQIRYKKVNEVTGKEVPFGDIVKAYKYGNEMIIVEDEDFKRAAPEKSDHLEIVQFVNEKDVDAVYFEKPYYLAPDKGGGKPYSLIRDALKKHNLAALGPMVYHGREWICLLKASGDVLVLHRLRFPEEIRPVTELNIPKADYKPEEMNLATKIIDQLKKPFDPSQFKDNFSSKLLEVIEAKASGKGGKVKQMKQPASTTTIDLMESLKASLKTSPRKKAS